MTFQRERGGDVTVFAMAVGAILVSGSEDSPVVIFMTRRAALCVVIFHGQGSGPPPLVALLTGDVRMFSPEREFGLTVIEFLVGDGVPVDGSVAGGTGRFVQRGIVRRFVTGAAVIERLRSEINGGSFLVVLHPSVAFLAGNGDMLPCKRKTGHAVIEFLRRVPAVGRVAISAEPVAGEFRFVG